MKKFINIICILTVCASLLFGCDWFDVGSYTHAENYEMGASCKKIFEAIRIFKNENPDMAPPQNFGYGKDGEGLYYLSAYFYYKNKDMGIVTVIHEKGTELMFVSVCTVIDGKKHCRSINEDIKGSENKAVKKEFEQRVVNPLKAILRR